MKNSPSLIFVAPYFKFVTTEKQCLLLHLFYNITGLYVSYTQRMGLFGRHKTLLSNSDSSFYILSAWVMTKKNAVILDYTELKKAVNREVSLVVYLFCVSKEMVCALHLLTH